MGILHSIFERFHDYKIILLGLDGAGKTSILYKLKMNQTIMTIPTIGFNVEQVIHKGMKITIWDVGGQDKIRPLWRHYFQNAQAIIFVIDSHDTDRFLCAQKELHKILTDEYLKNIPLLLLANKTDMQPMCNLNSLTQVLKMDRLINHPWYIQPSSAISGEGLYEGLNWVTSMIQK